MPLAKSLRRVRITGTGMFVPPDVTTNHDLEKLMETSDEWIWQRSGIRERRFAAPGIAPSDLAVEATKSALDMAGLSARDIDMVVFATLSPDYYFPGAGVFLQDKLGMGTTPALDVRNQCSGFLYGLSVAHLFVASGQHERVLLVGAETHSRALDFTTRGRDVAVLFGDGAGAVILEPSKDPEGGILSTHLHSEGAHKDHLKLEFPSCRSMPFVTHEAIESGGTFPRMDGKHVFKHAVHRIPEVIHEALAANHLNPDDISLYVFHQANIRITEAAMKALGQPMEKSFNNIERYGNCSAASIPMCLDEASRSGRLKRNDLICLASFGAGFTWGSAIIRW